VGQGELLVVFPDDPMAEPTVDVVSSAGQHDDFPTAIICEALAA